MALPTSTFATYQALGNREDLSDVIYRIDPTDTPFVTMAEKEKADAVNHEWQTQALAAAAANAQLEGDDPTTTATTPTVRLGNICQISYKVARVSGTQQAVDHAGRSNELAYQETLKGLELKRDIELVVTANTAKATGSTTVARTTATVLSWIKSNTSKGTAGSPADPAAADGTGTRTDASTLVNFTEARLKSVLNLIWVAGGKPDTIMTGAFNKQVFSTFTGRSTAITEPTKAQTIVASVDAYESDFGKMKVVANRFSRATDVLVLESDKWAIAYLKGRNMISIPLAKTGDSDRSQILSEYTVVARNEKSSGGVFDNSTS